METQTKISTWQDAMEYIASKYIFNAENYPVIAELDNDEKIFMFSFKHNFFHIVKSLGKIANGKAKLESGNPTDLLEIEHSLVKVIVGCLRVAELYGLNADDFVNENILPIGHGQYLIETFSLCGAIATEFEKYDRGIEIGDKNVSISQAMGMILAYSISFAKGKYFFRTHDEIFAMIPQVMKSK